MAENGIVFEIRRENCMKIFQARSAAAAGGAAKPQTGRRSENGVHRQHQYGQAFFAGLLYTFCVVMKFSSINTLLGLHA